MLWPLLFAIQSFFEQSNAAVPEKNYALYQAVPKNINDMQRLTDLRTNADDKISFWKPPTTANESVELMIPVSFADKLRRLLSASEIDHSILLNNVNEYLSLHDNPIPKSDFNQRITRNTNTTQSRKFQIGDYYSYGDIVTWMESLQSKHPNIARVISIGNSYENRPIKGIIIGTKRDSAKPVVWIDAGIHAREWAAVHTALFFVNELLDGYLKDSNIKEYVDLLDIYIFPCLNPDGYEFSQMSSRNPEIRLWRKNRSKETCMTKDGKRRCCRGVDLNRNFDFHFAEIGSSFSPCSEIYHGPHAFSEPETIAVKNFVLKLNGRLRAFITLHTYSQLWVYPFSNKKHSYPQDYDDVKEIAKQAVESLESLYGTQYRYGTGPEIIYAYSGGSADWAQKTTNVKYAYTIELRPSYFAWNGFVLDKRQLIPTGKETFEGVKVVIEKIIVDDKKARGIPITCANVSKHCKFWLGQNPGICQNSKPAMTRECKKSCAFC